MDELRFRGKVIGDNSKNYIAGCAFGDRVIDEETGRQYICRLSLLDEKQLAKDILVEVDPLTISRFTGSYIDGDALFEGDIISFCEVGYTPLDIIKNPVPAVVIYVLWDEDFMCWSFAFLKGNFDIMNEELSLNIKITDDNISLCDLFDHLDNDIFEPYCYEITGHVFDGDKLHNISCIDG